MAWPVGFMRAVAFFQCPEGGGFSEEYLADEADTPNPSVWAGGILTKRMDMLSDLYILKWVRISRPHDPRTLIRYSAAPAIGSHGTITDDAFERSEVGALVKFYTSSGRYSTRIFRGIKDSACLADGTISPTDDWYTALGTFLGYVIGTSKIGLINTRAIGTLPAYTFEKYQASDILRTSTRDMGRPFGLRRGRSAASAP